MIPRVLVATPPTGDLAPVLAALAASGPEVAVWLRRPGAATRVLLEEGTALAQHLGTATRLVIGGRVDVACALGAGVHLPERGLRANEARHLLGPDALIGASRHDAAGLRALRGASYATLSPLFSVPGKGPGLGAARFAALRRVRPELPVLALGGIDATSAAVARKAGADGVAVLRAVCDAPDPAEALARLREAVDTSARPPNA